jgi:SAM-dependent methyltransferase
MKLLPSLVFPLCCLDLVNGFSASKPPPVEPTTTRSDFLWKLPLGAIFTYGYGRVTYNALSLQHLKYPEAHEARVSATIFRAIHEASQSQSSRPNRNPTTSGDQKNKSFRILEVGIGKDLRLLQRGLYDRAFEAISSPLHRIHITGVDLQLPKPDIVKKVQKRLNVGREEKLLQRFELDLLKGSIASTLPFESGHFDAIVCCLTLCSVDNPGLAISEMKRLLRRGGTLAYVEHVAVNPDEPYRFLELQQTTLDPLQQRLAENCHLHRYTEDALLTGFGIRTATLETEALVLEQSRFMVDNMWPVSCQCSGVLQKL